MMYQRSLRTPTLTLLFLAIMFLPGALQSQIGWTESIDIAGSSYGNSRPRITSNAAGEALIIWGKSTDVMFARQEGSGFTTPIKLNPAGVTIATANWMGPEIAAHGDTVYVVYKQTPEDAVSSHIWCIRSFDGGRSFTSPVRVEDTGNDKSRFPTVTTDDDGHPVIAYMRFNTNFREARWVVTRSFDFGETFTTDVLASGWSGPDSEVCDCCPGTIQANGDQVVIIYRDNDDNLRDSWAGISTDGGITFARGVNVDQNGWMIGACPATGPDGVIVGDTLYTTFMNGSSGQAIVYYNETPLTNLSTPPSTPVPGSGEGLQQNFPRIDAFGQAAALLWRHSADFSTGLALMFTEDIANGFPTTFDTLAYSQVANGDVTMTETHVVVAWQDNSSSTVKFRYGTYQSSTATEEVTNNNTLPLYPNPVSTLLNLGHEAGTITIMNLSGQKVLDGKGSMIDVRSLSPGLYFIAADAGWGKFVKE